MEQYVNEYGGLLSMNNFKAASAFLYLPGATRRPEFQISCQLVPLLQAIPHKVELERRLNAILPKQSTGYSNPFKEFMRVGLEVMWYWSQLKAGSIEELEVLLNQSRSLFNLTADYFMGEESPVDAEWFLRAGTLNYVQTGLLISRAVELSGSSEERAGQVLQNLHRTVTALHRKDQPEKRPLLVFLFAQAFRLMFGLGRLGMFGSTLKLVTAFGVEVEGPRAHRADECMFLALKGVYEFGVQRVLESFALFNRVWQYLASHDFMHKRRILSYLIAIKLTFGLVPKRHLLLTYNLTNEFSAISSAIHTGNPVLLDSALQAAAPLLLRHHQQLYVFLFLNAGPACYLNLMRRCWRVAVKTEPTMKTRLPLEVVIRAAALMGLNLSLEELECILINLIGKGWIKGHIAHDARILVLSNLDPFPSVTKFFPS